MDGTIHSTSNDEESFKETPILPINLSLTPEHCRDIQNKGNSNEYYNLT